LKLNKRKIIAIFLFLLLLVIAVVRENVFLELNAIIRKVTYNRAYFYFFQESFTKLPYIKLMQLKWLLTALFSCIMALISFTVIYLWFKNKLYNKWTLLFYALLFGILLLLTPMLYGFNLFNNYYFIVRKIAGFIQSPLPLLLLSILMFYLNSRAKF